MYKTRRTRLCYQDVFIVLAVLTGSLSDFAEQVTRMTISPTGAARNPGYNLTVMCKSDRRLENCNFRVWFTNTGSTSKLNQDYPVMDFSRGAASEHVKELKFDQSGTVLYRARYHGKGLEKGECGVEFIPESQGRYLVGCRGRAVNEDWGYEFMALDVKYEPKEVDQNEIREEIVIKSSTNGELTFRHNAKQFTVLRSCTFFLLSTITKPRKYEAHRNDAYCTFTLRKLTEQDNGLLWYYSVASSSNEYYQNLYFKFIVIAKAPSDADVVLQLEGSGGPYSPGDELSASCSASNSRPVADMSWLLGGETIRQDAVNQDSDTAWRWPWDGRSIKQTLKRKLNSGDNGKKLTCRVKHEMLQEDIEKTIEIQMKEADADTRLHPDMTNNTTPTKPAGFTETSLAPSTTVAGTRPREGRTNHGVSSTTTTPAGSIETNKQSTASQPSTTVAGNSTEPREGREDDEDNSTSTITAILGVVLTLAILAAVVYARLARRCCFRRPGGVDTAAPICEERQKKGKPAARQVKPTECLVEGKPRAPTPVRHVTTPTRRRSTMAERETVDYAEIEGAHTSQGLKLKKSRQENHEDLTYAELTFQ